VDQNLHNKSPSYEEKSEEINIESKTTTNASNSSSSLTLEEDNEERIAGSPKDKADIFEVAKSGNAERLAKMISGLKDINMLDDCGWSLLHKAVAGKNVENVKLLIEFDINIDIHDSETKSSPLHLAVRNHTPNQKIIAQLLEAGADPLIKDKYGDSALHTIAADNAVIMELLLSYCKSDSINLENEDRWTPLKCAIHRGHHNIVKYLADKGALINEDVLFLAAYTGNVEAIKILQKHIDINTADSEGKNVLDYAKDGLTDDGRTDYSIIDFLLGEGIKGHGDDVTA